MADTARVIPLAPVEQAYTYRVPPELAAEAVPGARVVVPFGRRTITGVVAERTNEDRPRLKAIKDVLDDVPAFSPTLLRLARFIADYYVCAPGEVLRAALPAGATVESRRLVRPTGEPASDAVGRRVLDALDGTAVTFDVLLGDGITHYHLRRLERDGVVAFEQELTDEAASVQTVTHLRLTAAGALTEPAELRGEKQQAVLAALLHHRAEGETEPSQPAVLGETDAATSTVKSLIEKGLVERVEREVVRTPFGDEAPATPPVLTLHEAQRHALDRLGAAVESRRHATFLLHGVTGSGKTEVYLQALRQTLNQGRTGIVLVPEIALTPQTVRRFRAHFGDRIAVLHSRMSAGERFDAWRMLRDGRCAVAIGPRSAVFAPLDNVGLIVVDEEHEASYKQFDPAPRYHARDVAVMRAHLEGAVCLLGSATPSLESLRNAETGKYERLAMPVRVPVAGHAAAPLPTVRVVDLAWEHKTRRLRGALALPLREAIRARVEAGEGVILLQNRRGYSPVVSCADCGFTPTCTDCAVSLTLHRAHRHLRCHYCGAVEPVPPRCPACGSPALEPVGVGTQRVEEELAEVVPTARVLRMDLDTTSRKNAHRRILDAFGRGDADILLGTQMVAKGLDFDRVTLVGVIDADTGLTMPDFRASERTFQLLAQVAGRAGRGDRPGEVLIQTRTAEHPAILHARTHDFDGFAAHELAERAEFGYPPFGRMASVEFKGPDADEVERVASRWTEALASLGGPLDVLGPEPAFIGRVKKQYRMHTLVRAHPEADARLLSRVLREADRRFGSPPKGVRVNIDIDPAALL